MPMHPVRVWLLAVICLGAPLAAGAEPPAFEARTLDPNVGQVCYAVITADVDGNQRPDVVAVTENRVVWYRNPDWKSFVIIEDQTERDNVCIAPYDIDFDGKVDFALGAGWLNNKHLGTLYWLSRGPSLDQKWNVHPIGRESWTHRARWGDFLATGKPQLIVSPLNKTAGDGVRLLAFEIPDDPRQNPWKQTLLDQSLNAMHAHWVGDLDGDGAQDVLTASMEGVFWLRRGADGQFHKRRLAEGAPGPLEAQKSGAGEVRVYLAPTSPNDPWQRTVVDATLSRGHAIGVADVDRDGNEDLIIGHSDKGTGDPSGPGVFLYMAANPAGTTWAKHVIDNGGIATEDLAVFDANGDGWPDVVAGGRATRNVRLYLNQGSR